MKPVIKFGFALAFLAICAFGFFSMNVEEAEALIFTPFCQTSECGYGGPPPNHTDIGPCLCPPTNVPCRLYRNNDTGIECHDNCR